MVRQITPREREILHRIREYNLASRYAEFDATRDDIQYTELKNIEKRVDILVIHAHNLLTIEKEYETLTDEELPEDCSDILKRICTSCQTLTLELIGDDF